MMGMTVAPSRAKSLSLSLNGVRPGPQYPPLWKKLPGIWGQEDTRLHTGWQDFAPPMHQELGMSPPEGKVTSFVVGLIYYCLTSSDTDIPPPGLRTPGPSECDLSNKIQYKEWTATHMHPQLKLQ